MKFPEGIETEPWNFDLLSILRLMERQERHKPRIGDSAARDEEVVLLGQEPYLEFPASNLSRFDRDAKLRIRIFSRFLGMLGPQGALPLQTTVEARQWNEARDEAFTSFIDIFNHRFISLFFRAWADARPAAQHDRPDNDRFIAYIGSAAGIGTAPFRNRDSIADVAKLAVAGLLAPAAKSASRIESMIAHFFGVKTDVEQLVGSWLPLGSDECTTLGGRNAALGQDAMLGSAVYSVMDKFRIRIHTDSLAQFETFLPAGRNCRQMADLIYFYLGELLDYDVQLLIPEAEIRPAAAGSFGRLGWTTWMMAEGSAGAGIRGDCTYHPADRAAPARTVAPVAESM